MTGTIAPTAPPGPPNAAASSAPTDGAHAEPQAPFGPALARAQERVARRPTTSTTASTTRESEPNAGSSEESTSGDDVAPPTNRDTVADGSRVAVGNTAVVGNTVADEPVPTTTEARTSTAATSNPATSDGTGSAATVAAPLTTTGLNGADPSADAPPTGASAVTDEPNPTTESSESTAEIAADLTAPDHPTAKGIVGDGGPSTIPTVEGSAPPTAQPSRPIQSGEEAGPGGPGVPKLTGSGLVPDNSGATAPLDPSSAASANSAEAAASGDTTADLAGPNAISTVAATGAAAAAPAAPAAGAATAGNERASTPDTVAVGSERANRSTPEAVNPNPGGDGTASIEGSSAETVSQRSSSAQAEPATGPGAATSADGGEGLVVLAREAGRNPDAARPVNAQTPTAGPLNTSEGSLWEDVRMAFDRIRSSGDSQEVRIRLRPAELGELVVQVRTQGENVAVRLTTSSQAAQQALVDDRLRLAAELARAGFEEGSVDIGRDDSGNLDDPGRGSLNDPGRGSDGERGRGRVIPEPVPGTPERRPLERRDPIRTESGVRLGRHAYSTINLTL